ncbi:MAG: TetR/AcrR family transcriptional regulator C-terminal domain-containing protein [Oscillibacter sp.]|nr:TetR/AcrR family transcriptional regulator C-terminal domain-containing protein [Oscillibacter sp.]
MADVSEDRRVKRSRKLLKQGFMDLLREKGFARISVRDITDRADMNRGTFYLHYPDTAALMRSVEEDMLQEAQTLIDAHLQEAMDGHSLRPLFEPLLDYVVERRDACATLFKNDSCSGFLEGIQRLACENGRRLIARFYPALTESQAAYFTSFAAFGLTGLMKTWFDGGMSLPKERLLELADNLVTGAASALSAQ